MTTIKNKNAVITSGANGIGKCIADELEKNGAFHLNCGDHFILESCKVLRRQKVVSVIICYLIMLIIIPILTQQVTIN